MIVAIIGVIYVGYYKSNSSTVIRVASGERTSYLFQIGKELKQAIETRSDYKVELVESGSSGINRGALQSGKADVALISQSATDMTNLAVIAPIEKHLLHIVVHVDSGIRSIYGLSGKRISLGGLKSDHRKAAYKLLEHYQIEESSLLNTEVSHLDLLEGRNLDGAIISTSVNDTYMKKLMSSGNFSLISIDAAEGFVERNNLYQNANFAMGVYPSSFGPMPDKWLPTVSENVWLVSRLDLSSDIVNMLIDVMETKNFTLKFPLLSKWLKESEGNLTNCCYMM
ncbi:TAXI family TRAP transporter solute-binding subunit [Psychrosphaera algicola]|uniref:TAXI family TRAP transporter solute-binding subunit n=1 Tax=Psychrosphaera algicola TaxID=3023714 RepID=A0ABT5FFT0_9GAMM|nr:TAXI family TRAP transporter solute-binding subunit [Psychrosphaera sp. G1-22]MDC2890186.1 TAXI family TRAP transporter solute-binding subunit [Psychrosphaera sp. G1-22]